MNAKSPKDPGLVIDGLYVERSSFAHRSDYLKADEGAELVFGLKMGTLATYVDKDHAVFRMRAWSDDSKSLVSFDVTIVALVARSGEDSLDLKEFGKSPAIISTIFPYLRSVVGDLTMRGRFGPVWLPMINPASIKMLDAEETKAIQAALAAEGKAES